MSKFPLGFPWASVSPMREVMAGQARYPREDILPGLGRILAAMLDPFCCPLASGDPAKDVTRVKRVPGTLTGMLWLPWRLVIWRTGAGWKQPPGKGNVFLGRLCHLASWRRKERCLPAWPRAQVHLLWERSGCCVELPCESGGELGAASPGRWGRPLELDGGPRVGAEGSGERLLAFCQTQASLQKGPLPLGP